LCLDIYCGGNIEVAGLDGVHLYCRMIQLVLVLCNIVQFLAYDVKRASWTTTVRTFCAARKASANSINQEAGIKFVTVGAIELLVRYQLLRASVSARARVP
jgi:hypothetical protein